MENAVKALLIAAGMLIAVLIISLLVFLYNQISTYYTQQHELTVTEQTQEFNAKFENYHRNDIRGSDLISLMNRVIDYNASQSYQEGTNYERIKVTITLGDDDILEQFKGTSETAYTTSRNQFLLKEITNTTGTGVNWETDKQLIAITKTPSVCIEDAKGLEIENLTEQKLQQLSANIANIIVDEKDETSSMAAYNRFKRAELLEDILGIEVQIDEITGITTSNSDKKIINGIKEIVSQYHQYMQFKRAYFDCTEVIYDQETNRVVEMNFKLQVKDGDVVGI